MFPVQFVTTAFAASSNFVNFPRCVYMVSTDGRKIIDIVACLLMIAILLILIDGQTIYGSPGSSYRYPMLLHSSTPYLAGKGHNRIPKMEWELAAQGQAYWEQQLERLKHVV